MYNMLKMDLFRMFRSKSLYVISLVFVGIIIMTTFLLKSDLNPNNNEAMQEVIEEQQDNTNIGMSVNVKEEAGKYTLSNIFSSNAQAKTIAIFMVIFTVLYATSDFNNGYIKNIGGQVKRRETLIFSKAISLFVYTVYTIALFLVAQFIASYFILGYVDWGNVKQLLPYIGIQVVLHYAFVVTMMALSVIIRNNLISMIIVICLCMNVGMIIYSGIDKIIAKIGVKDFSIVKYVVSGRIAMISPGDNTKAFVGSLIVSAVFIVVSLLVSSTIFKKRDIV